MIIIMALITNAYNALRESTNWCYGIILPYRLDRRYYFGDELLNYIPHLS